MHNVPLHQLQPPIGPEGLRLDIEVSPKQPSVMKARNELGHLLQQVQVPARVIVIGDASCDFLFLLNFIQTNLVHWIHLGSIWNHFDPFGINLDPFGSIWDPFGIHLESL